MKSQLRAPQSTAAKSSGGAGRAAPPMAGKTSRAKATNGVDPKVRLANGDGMTDVAASEAPKKGRAGTSTAKDSAATATRSKKIAATARAAKPAEPTPSDQRTSQPPQTGKASSQRRVTARPLVATADPSVAQSKSNGAKSNGAKSNGAPRKGTRAVGKPQIIAIAELPVITHTTDGVANADANGHADVISQAKAKAMANGARNPRLPALVGHINGSAHAVARLPITELPMGYRPSDREPFMGDLQRLYFRRKLATWRDEILHSTRETLQSLHDDQATYADIADRATSESDKALELRARDRQRKLIAKIDAAIERIDRGTYGYCDETGEPIAVKRLDARPIATLSIEAQERHERRERVYRDD